MWKRFKGEIGLFCAAFIWGGGFPSSKLAVVCFTPNQVVAIRFFLASVVLSVVFHRKFQEIDRRTLRCGIALGCILFLPYILQMTGIQYTTASKTAFLISTNVAFVPFVGLVFFRRRIDAWALLGAFVALFGAGVMSWESGGAVNFGDVLCLLTGVCLAFHIYFTFEFLARGCDPFALNLTQIITTFVCAFCFLAASPDPWLPNLSGAMGTISLYGVLYLSFFSTLLGFMLQTVSQRHTSSTTAAIILSLESFFGSVMSVAILDEPVSFRLVLGGGLIMAAIAISELKPGLKGQKTAI